MRKQVHIVILIVGIALIIIGLLLPIPSKELTTYSFKGSEYSIIEEYVGGDAYNYIIGAALVGGEISGAMTQKAVFIAVGALIVCIGVAIYALQNRENDVVPQLQEDIVTEEPENDEQ